MTFAYFIVTIANTKYIFVFPPVLIDFNKVTFIPGKKLLLHEKHLFWSLKYVVQIPLLDHWFLRKHRNICIANALQI